MTTIRVQYFHSPIRSKSWAVRRGNIMWKRMLRFAGFCFTRGGIGVVSIGISPMQASMTCAEIEIPDHIPQNEIEIFLAYMNGDGFNAYILPLTENAQPV